MEEPQSSPRKHTVTFSDVPKASTSATTEDAPLTQEILAQMASALDKVATTFTTTATQLRDTKETQNRTLEELAQLRRVVEKLLEDVLVLVEKDKASKG